jgi:hypothetical protein
MYTIHPEGVCVTIRIQWVSIVVKSTTFISRWQEAAQIGPSASQ